MSFLLANPIAVLCFFLAIVLWATQYLFLYHYRIFGVWVSSLLSIIALCFSVIIGYDYAKCVVYLVIYFFAVMLFSRLFRWVLIQQLQKKSRMFWNSNYEIIPADPSEFPWLDMEYYDSIEKQLVDLGFHKVGDQEFLSMSKAFPETRNFSRIMRNQEKSIVASFGQVRFNKFRNTLSKKEDRDVVEFRTEFSDGSFLTSSNTEGVNPGISIQGVTVCLFPPSIQLSELLDEHKAAIQTKCRENGIEVRLISTEQELFESGKRRFLLLQKMPCPDIQSLCQNKDVIDKTKQQIK